MAEQNLKLSMANREMIFLDGTRMIFNSLNEFSGLALQVADVPRAEAQYSNWQTKSLIRRFGINASVFDRKACFSEACKALNIKKQIKNNLHSEILTISTDCFYVRVAKTNGKRLIIRRIVSV